MYLQSTSGLSLVATPPSSSSRHQPPNTNLTSNNNNNNTSGSFASSSSATSNDKRQRPANSFAYRAPSPDDDDLPPPLSTSTTTTSQQPLLPDLSHLSESERRQIESVLQRQLAEEQQQASAQLNPSIPFRSNTTNHSFTATLTNNNSNNIPNSIKSSSNSRVETLNRRNHNLVSQTSTNSNYNSTTLGGNGGTGGNILSSSSFYSNQVDSSSSGGGGQQSHPLVNSQRHSISDIAQEAKQRYGSIDTGNVCDVCKKTKFSNATVGHACFHCKSRSCIRCSFKFTYKNQQLWSCIECKKKQEALLLSAFNKSNSNKQFASDYILNKANADDNNNNNNNTSQEGLPHENNKTSSNMNASGGGRRMLPTIGGGGGGGRMVKQESLDNNQTSRQLQPGLVNRGYNNSTSAQMVTTNAVENDIRIPVRRGAAMTTRIQRHDQESEENYNEEQNHFTSNNSANHMNDASYNSSPSSSVSQHLNRRSDRVQDPAQMLRKMSNGQSLLRTGNNINETTSNIDAQKQPTTGRKLLPTPYQAINNNSTNRSNLVIKHTDSLSSDPSDLPQMDGDGGLDHQDEDQYGPGSHLSRKQSSKKRTRKQPPLPVSNPNLLKQKLLAKLSVKQHSFTSSDDENLNDYDNNPANIINPNSQIQDKKIKMTGRGGGRGGAVEYEDEDDTEDLNNIDDEELRSTTEYTTNDEMDMESASVSMRANARLNVNMPNQHNNMNINNNNTNSHLANRLVGANLNNKDEILAAKMSNFLSPTNWQLSLDGKKMIAHVVLRRNVMPFSESNSTLDSAMLNNNNADDFISLGLHAVGGVPNPLTKQPSAYVVNVRKESVSDTVGRLQAGDEIVKWNETLLRGLSRQQALAVMQASKNESQVELVVERTLDDFVKDQLRELIKEYDTSSKVNESSHRAGHRPLPNQPENSNHVVGNVQIKIFFDSYDQKLFVNVLIVNLDQHTESLFCKLHLISTKNQNHLLTKLSEVCSLDRSSNQYFVNEAFTFEPVSFNDFEYTLEVELVNYASKSIIGKAKLDLSDETLENQMFELEIFRPFSNTHNAINKSLPYAGARMHNDTSLESLTKSSSGGGGGRGRRQLPQLPPPVKKMLPQPPAQKSLPLPPKLSQFQAGNRAISHDPNDDYERSNQTKKPHSLNNKYTNESDQSDSESRPPATSTAIPRRSILPTSSLPTGGGESTSYSPPPTSSRSKNQMQMMANMRKSSQPPSNNNIDSTESNSQLINHLQNSDSDVSNYAQRQSNRQNQSLAQRKSIASPPTNLDHLPSNKLKQLNKQTVSKRIEMNENEMSSSPQLWPDSAADSQNVDNNTRNDVNNRQQDYVASSPSPPPGSSASVSDLRRNGVKKPGQYGNLMNLAASTQAVNMDAEDRFLNKEANMFRPLNSQAASQPRLQVNKSLTNINSVKPEKLFSAKLLNQKAQNASRNNLQQLANQVASSTNVDSDVASDLSSPSVRSDSQNKVNMVSQLANDPNRTTTVSTSVNGATTTTTVTNKDPTTPSSATNMAIMDDSNMFENMNLYTTANAAPGSATTSNAPVVTQPSTTSYQLTPQLSSSKFKEPLTPLQQQQLILLQQQQGGIFLNAMKPKPAQPQPVQQQQSYTDGTLSDSALSSSMVESGGGPTGANKKRRPSMAKALVILGLSKKSNSASNLTVGKRIGFARVSEEYGVTPELRNRNLSPPGSADSAAADDKPPKFWSGALKLPHELLFSTFIENLGPGQKVSRQALGLPCQGELKLKISSPDKQKFTIEILEARNLKQSTMYRITPNVYVKFYVFQGNVCAEKQKTVTQRRTLTPSFKDPVRFESDFRGKVLQVTVWAEYGKMSTDRKNLMGIAQIVLDDINLITQDHVTGWYRLYPAGSIISDISVILGQTDLSGTDSGYSISSQR